MTSEIGLVDNLVTQFSSAFDCFRELVQNAIDAGSPRVVVWTAYEAGADHIGTIKICVEDDGEGMDEAIIDEELTKLFSSSKENDLTKIGKFGIGFVSVFALQPAAVLVHTGRAGEWWEILFHEDRTFTKSRLDSPVEGTTVTLFLSGDYHRYRELATGVEASLRKWCCHATTEITFEDRTPPPGSRARPVAVNEPFELNADCVLRYEAPGMEILLGYHLDPTYGFYNSGLTLAQTQSAEDVWGAARAPRYQHIAVKVSSRYLEHTLSRDTVMRDENWERVLGEVMGAIDLHLPVKLIDEIESLAASVDWSMQTMHRYATLTSYLAREPDEVVADVVVRKVFRDVNGSVWTPEQVFQAYRKDGRVLIAEGPSELSRRIGALGIPVILGKWSRSTDSWEKTAVLWSDHPLESVPVMVSRFVAMRSRSTFWGTVKRFFGVNLVSEVESALADPQLVYLPVAVDENPPENAERLLEHSRELLEKIGADYKALATFVPSAASRDVPFFVTGREFADVMARPPRGFEDRSHAAVNREHPHFRRLVKIYASQPSLAAYCLAKSLLLTEDRLLHADLDLMKAAMADDHPG